MKQYLALLLLLTALITPPLVSAQGPFEPITDLIGDVALGMADIITFGGLDAGEKVGLYRLILFFIVFTLFFMGGQVAFAKQREEGRKYAAIFAGLLSLIFAVAVPASFITYAVNSFAVYIMVAMFLATFGLPLYVMYSVLPIYVHNRKALGGVRALIALVSIFLISTFSAGLGFGNQSPSTPSQNSLGGALAEPVVSIFGTLNSIVLLIFTAIFIYETVKMFTGGKAKKKVKKGSNWAKDLYEENKKKREEKWKETVKQDALDAFDEKRRSLNNAKEREEKVTDEIERLLGLLRDELYEEPPAPSASDKTMKDRAKQFFFAESDDRKPRASAVVGLLDNILREVKGSGDRDGLKQILDDLGGGMKGVRKQSENLIPRVQEKIKELKQTREEIEQTIPVAERHIKEANRAAEHAAVEGELEVEEAKQMYPDLKSFFDDKDETVSAEELRATAEANEEELSRLEDVYESAGKQIQGLEEDLLPDLEANLELTASGPDQEEILRRYERFAQIAEQKPKQAQNLIRKEIEETAEAESKGPLEILRELRENVYSPLVEAWESLMTGVKKLNHKDEQLQEQLRPIEEHLSNEIKQSAIGKQLQKQFDQS